VSGSSAARRTGDEGHAQRVREAEGRLAEVERITHTGSWEWDMVRDRILWSAELYRIFGLPPADEIGFDLYVEMVHPGDRERVQETLDRAMETGERFDYQHRIVRPDGEVRLVQSRGEVMSGSRGEPVRMVGTAQDVTRAAEAGEERDRRIREEAARAAAEESERRARFLAEAGRILSASLDYETTLRNVADLAVQEIADWCAVDLAPAVAGDAKRVVVAHRNPERVRLAETLQERYPPNPDLDVGAPAVIRSGEPQLVPEIPPELLEQAAQDEEHLRMLHELGLVSLMVVPLRGRDSVLGAITFVSAESGRRYGEEDLELAEDLGSRAAQAVENALLLRAVTESRDQVEAQANELEAQADALENQAAELEEAHAELEASHDQLAQAHSELEIRTEEAEAAARRQRFLAEASEVLASSLDYEATLEKVGELAVREIADWCAIDVLGADGNIRRLTVAHPDPEKRKLAMELAERYPEDPAADRGVGHVLRTGEPELVPDIPPGLLEEVAQDEEHLRILRELGLLSYMVVPFKGRQGVLGALTLIGAESGWRFDETDLQLAKELARRAAAAIENAILFREVTETRDHLEAQASELEAQAELLQSQAAEMEEVQAELEASRDDLLEVNRELEARTREAEHARDEAETANAAKAAFLAAMSHELRTPLNAIGGYVELVEMEVYGPVTQKQRGALERVRRSQRLLLSLINDILNFAKIEAGSLDYDIEPVPLRPLLVEMCTMMRPQFKAKGVRFTLEEGDEGVAALADREKTEQIVLNLIGNAVKFTPKGGEITVSWRGDDDHCTIAVQDTGRGIPADRLKEVFEAFVQIDRDLADRSEGVGLGLSISQNLAHAMGGELEAESEPGTGSTFVLRLPRAT
jgi:two-component system, NarL family, sensor histidine kinase BarA